MAVSSENVKVKKALEYLKTCDDYSTEEANEAIWDLKECVSWNIENAEFLKSENHKKCIELSKYMTKEGVVPLIVRIMKSLKNYDLDAKNQEQNYTCLIATLMLCVQLTFFVELNDMTLDFVKHGGIELLLSMLEPSNHLGSNMELIETVLILSILGNCVEHPDSVVRSTYRDCNAVPLLMKYLKSTKIMVKIKTLKVLAYIVNDKESDVIASTEECIAHMVDILKRVVGHADDGFAYHIIGRITFRDGLYGLIGTTNRLAVNAANKREIVKHGGIPIITQIITHRKAWPKAKQNAIETLWKLAFVDRHRKEISRHLKDTGSVRVLEELQKSKYCALREASTGLLWKLDLIDVHDDSNQTKFRRPPQSYEGTVAGPHIFISYSPGNNQERVKKLRERLKGAGFFVWMDIDKTGSGMKAKADAIDKASIVLLCASSAYHQCVYCEQEANYAFTRKRLIIPIVMEENYESDGWLGLLIAGKFQFKLCTDEMIESQIPLIIREIKRLSLTL